MTENAQLLIHLAIAAAARATLTGRRQGHGFWTMPAGRPFVMACYRRNIDMARRARLQRQAPAARTACTSLT